MRGAFLATLIALVATGCDRQAATSVGSGLPASTSKPEVAQAPPTSPAVAVGSCSHELTVATLQSVVLKNIGTGRLMQDRESIDAAQAAFAAQVAQLGLSAIRTVSRDEKLQLSVCRAMLTMAVPVGTLDRIAKNLILAAAIGAGGWRNEGTGLIFASDVEYSAQPTDDGQHVFVELGNADPIIQGAGLLAIAASVTARESVPAATALPAANLLPAQGVAGRDGPSFDCGKASAPAERMICAEPQLASVDAQLAAQYKKALQSAGDRGPAIKEQQRQWLSSRRNSCQDSDCMLAAYKERLSELSR